MRRMGDEYINKIEHIKVALKVNSCHIEIKENGEAYGPYARGIPPMSESILQDNKAMALLRELFDKMRSVTNK